MFFCQDQLFKELKAVYSLPELLDFPCEGYTFFLVKKQNKKKTYKPRQKTKHLSMGKQGLGSYYRSSKVSLHGAVSKKLQLYLSFPFPAVLHIFMAAQTVLTKKKKNKEK